MRGRLILSSLIIGIGAVVAVYNASRPDPDLLQFRSEGGYAYGYGDTDDRSVQSVKAFLNAHPDVHTLVLKDMPGTKDIDMNMRIAREIRKRDLNTHLDTDSFIASGAVDLFLAGTNRTMVCGAQIGVHSWSLGGVVHPARLKKDPEQKKHETFLKEMGIDPAFYAFTRDSALPSDLYFLTAKDIERFGILTQPLKCP